MLKNYIKIAWKVLLRRKFFTFISLFGISFTLMILMVITAMVDHVIGARAPESNFDRMVMVAYMKTITNKGGMSSGSLSYDFLKKHVKTLESAENVSIISDFSEVNAYINNKKLVLDQKFTDENFWQITDFNFIEGKGFSKVDVDRGNRVAVISKDTKDDYFGNSPAVGKTITVDGKNFKVLGVVDNVPYTRYFTYANVWLPLTIAPEKLKQNHDYRGGFMAIILAKNKNDLQLIKDEYQKVMGRLNKLHNKSDETLVSNADNISETISRMLFGNQEDSNLGTLIAILTLLMLLFMLLPTINLININISRIMERSSEIGVRKAFGATKNTLVGQFLVENIFLTLLGSVLGLMFSMVVLKMINNSGIIPYVDFSVNYTVLIYGFIIALIFGIISGVFPAYKMSRMQAVEALKGGVL